MFRKCCAVVALVVWLSSATYADESGPTKRPNIVLILLDDTGYSDYGCYGSEIATPNIDRLAPRGCGSRSFIAIRTVCRRGPPC